MCSYCGCESIEVIGRFMAEHEGVINACGDLRRAIATGNPVTVTVAATTLAGLLDPHTRAEEVGLFAILAEDGEFTEHIARLCAEHVDLDHLLGQIAAGGYEAFPAFERALRDHIDREENGLFPAAAIQLAGPDWDRVTDLTPAS